MVPGDPSFRPGGATADPIGPVPRRSAAARTRRGPRRADPARGHATTPAAAMGRCWLACQLYEQLELDRFWAARLPIPAKEPAGGTFSRRWRVTGSSIRAANGVYTGLVRAKRHGRSARRRFRAGRKNALYRCLDKLVEHKPALFTHCAGGGRICSAPASTSFSMI